jgi:hypothetical protein
LALDGFEHSERRFEADRQGADMAQMKGILASLVAFCGFSLLLTACGGSGVAPASAGQHPASGTTVATHLGTSSTGGDSTPSAVPTRAQGQAFARGVNLSTSDIPEAVLAPKRSRGSDAQEKREFHACEDHGLHVKSILEATSPRLKRGRELETEQFSSTVSVVASAGAIAHEFAVLQGASVRECLARALTRNFSAKAVRDAHWGHFTLSRLPISVPGASATLGIRATVALNLSYSEVSVPIYVDMLAFAVGHGAVELTAVSVTQPVPAATEQELLALLLARAKAHSI